MNARHVRRAGARRRALGLAVVGTAVGVLGIASSGLAGQPDPEEGTQTICHATGSKSNPYVMETVNNSAIISAKSGKTQGHGKHMGDVIPAFSIPRQAPPNPPDLMWDFPGRNVAAGEALLANKCATLTIKKTGTASVLPGETIDYQVVVTNVGLKPVDFDWIAVKDKMVPLVPPTPPIDGTLDAGKSATWVGQYDVPGGTRICGATIENTASVKLRKRYRDDSRSRLRRANEYPMPMPMARQQSTWMTDVVCPLDLAVAKTTAQANVVPGGTVNYNVDVTNTGPLAVPTELIQVTDAGATLTPPVEPPDMLEPTQSLRWTATKAAGTDTALCGTNVTNTATVAVVFPENWEGPKYTFTAGADDTSNAPGVLIAGGTCPVVAPVAPATVVALRPAAASLTVTKTGPARILAGGTGSYRLTVTNTGGSDATGVVLRDQPPSSLALRAKPAGSRLQGTAVLWDIGTIPAGQSVSKTIRFTSRRTATGRKCNTAFVVATGVETAQARACTVVVAARRPVTPVTG